MPFSALVPIIRKQKQKNLEAEISVRDMSCSKITGNIYCYPAILYAVDEQLTK